MILNKTTSKINLCQFKNSSDRFIITELPPFEARAHREPTYIFHYDFIPNEYFLEIEVPENKKLMSSCEFKLDQFPGSTFTIKIKKENQNVELEDYENRFYYFQINIKKK
jgi:hypothetical protein